jgi:hypothetical protein
MVVVVVAAGELGFAFFFVDDGCVCGPSAGPFIAFLEGVSRCVWNVR